MPLKINNLNGWKADFGAILYLQFVNFVAIARMNTFFEGIDYEKDKNN